MLKPYPTLKLNRKQAKIVTDKMHQACLVVVKSFRATIAGSCTERGYVSRQQDAHSFDIRRSIKGWGDRPRLDGYFLCVVRSSAKMSVTGSYHVIDVLEFADKNDMCRAYDYLFAARINA